MTRAETDGFLAPLDGLTVVVGEAQGKPSMPYVLVYPSLEFDVQERVTGSYAPRDVTHTLHCIGATYEQARWLDEQVDKRLRPKGRGVTPVVPTRSCGVVRREFSRGPVSDDEIQDNVFDAISEYVFRSRPK